MVASLLMQSYAHWTTSFHVFCCTLGGGTFWGANLLFSLKLSLCWFNVHSCVAGWRIRWIVTVCKQFLKEYNLRMFWSPLFMTRTMVTKEWWCLSVTVTKFAIRSIFDCHWKICVSWVHCHCYVIIFDMCSLGTVVLYNVVLITCGGCCNNP